MHLRINHRTIYRYSTPAIDSHNEMRLEPQNDGCQTCVRFDIHNTPPTRIYSFSEIGGIVHHFTLRTPHNALEINAESEVETFCSNPFNGLNLIEPDLDYYKSDAVKQKYAEFLVPSALVPESKEAHELASEVLRSAGGVTTQFLLALNHYLFENFTYDSDVTHVHSTVDEVFALKAGVCQDFTHVMLACLRSVGIPARYVSGYLYSSQGSGIRGHEGMHAWVEVPLPDGRWLALDPTNNLLANDHHIRVHSGRDYQDITPLRGMYFGPRVENLDVYIHVEEISDARKT